jgi:ATP-dependent RNA circularization protein (DNA/RNA ligase family)
MYEYHKINSIFKRNESGKFIIEEYSLDEFDFLKNNIWIFTEKVDGTNIRVIWDKEKVLIKGKTDNAQIYAPLIERINELFPVEKLKQMYPETPMTLYGEGYGARIQKGGGNYKSDGVDFVLFDVFINQWWLTRDNVEDIAKKLGLQVVPIIGQGSIDDAIELAKKGFKSQWGDFIAEGIVLRPKTELFTRNGNRIITKVKHKDFIEG